MRECLGGALGIGLEERREFEPERDLLGSGAERELALECPDEGSALASFAVDALQRGERSALARSRGKDGAICCDGRRSVAALFARVGEPQIPGRGLAGIDSASEDPEAEFHPLGVATERLERVGERRRERGKRADVRDRRPEDFDRPSGCKSGGAFGRTGRAPRALLASRFHPTSPPGALRIDPTARGLDRLRCVGRAVSLGFSAGYGHRPRSGTGPVPSRDLASGGAWPRFRRRRRRRCPRALRPSKPRCRPPTRREASCRSPSDDVAGARR
jgi:hypothetical protein